jgi:hypothetical protein
MSRIASLATLVLAGSRGRDAGGVVRLPSAESLSDTVITGKIKASLLTYLQ